MKIRQGFVSNSSSSSFVILGIRLDESLKQKYVDLEGDDVGKPKAPTPKDTKVVTDDGPYMLGLVLANGNENDFSGEERTMDELIRYAKEFEEMIGVKPKLLAGVRAC